MTRDTALRRVMEGSECPRAAAGCLKLALVGVSVLASCVDRGALFELRDATSDSGEAADTAVRLSDLPEFETQLDGVADHPPPLGERPDASDEPSTPESAAESMDGPTNESPTEAPDAASQEGQPDVPRVETSDADDVRTACHDGGAAPSDAGADSATDSVRAGIGPWIAASPCNTTTSAPSPRMNTTMAYDITRDRAVLFGGIGPGGILGDTWELDPTTAQWRDGTICGTSAASPPRRSSHSMAYDSASAKILLFGGIDESINQAYGDLWEFEGGTGRWRSVNPAAGSDPWPAPRLGTSLAFDAARSKLVLFGGRSAAGTTFGDTWEWDPMIRAWADRTPALTSDSPVARTGHSMTYDSTRAKVILWSGGDGRDLWEWDGVLGVWKDRTPTSLPLSWPGRGGIVDYDPRSGALVLYHGTREAGDLWEWYSGLDLWADRTPSPLPASWPRSRGGFGMALRAGATTSTLAMFGGREFNSIFYRDTWVWDAASGTWADRSTPESIAWPSTRTFAGLAYDDQRDRIVAFGGAGTYMDADSRPLADIWEWDGDAHIWENRTPFPLPASWPRPRSGFGFAFDEAHGKAFVFAGIDRFWTWDDVLEWNGTSGTWTNRTPTPRPSSWPEARQGVATAYDSTRQRIVVYGGWGSVTNRPLADLREWNGSDGTWTERLPASDTAVWPGPLHGHAMAYDRNRRVMVLFGGGPNTGIADTWEWDGALWTKRTPAGAHPSARENPSMVYDAERRRVLLFGGWVGPVIYDDAWEWDGAAGTWTERKKATGGPWPAGRAGGAMTYDCKRRRSVMFAGTAIGSVLNDVWEWDGQP